MRWGKSMKRVILLIFLACFISSCENEPATPDVPPYPDGRAFIDFPTSDETYSTFASTVYLSGWRASDISEVTWANTSSGAFGSGIVGSYMSTCCFLFTCWDCMHYYWYALDLPLQDGENMIKIYGNGSWADSIAVTKIASFGLSGTVTNAGTGQLGVKLSLVDTTNASYTAYTDVNGFYSFEFIPSGTYTLTITDPCYTFTPPGILITGTTSGINGQDFVINTKSAATISGRISFLQGGTGVYGASVTLSSATTSTVLSNPAGDYVFTCVQDGSYVITPSYYYFSTFTPGSVNVTVIGGADISSQNFQLNN
jgi:hypothetical protein